MLEAAGPGTLLALLAVIAASVYLGTMARRVVKQSAFLRSYFLGNRDLGSWALALTATVQSGGTFMGFPSYVYSYGWIVALWIASYMVVPISGFGVLGKRLAQLSRRLGALTVPDIFRARFNSPRLGLISSLLILLFMTSMMVAQFKAGALIMKVCWPGSGALTLNEETGDFDTYYYLGLGIFSVTVVGYTLIGGFLAAVWTDLFQSILMLIGVMTLLPLVLLAAGGLPRAAEALRYEVPFREASAAESNKEEAVRLRVEARLKQLDLVLHRFAQQHGDQYPESLHELGDVDLAFDPATGRPLHYYGKGQRPAPLGAHQRSVIVATPADDLGWRSVLYSNGTIRAGPASRPGSLSTGPGPNDFHPLGLAVSFFALWVFTGMGSPASMVRVMASKSTDTIRRSIYLLASYNTLIYLPLIVICVCARYLIPDLPPSNSDEIIPRLSLQVTAPLFGGSLLAGLILAAPFGAVMATVSSYLVVIASGLVRDIYQRFLRPEATSYELRRMSYLVMIGVGLLAVAANIRPVQYLQAIVVFSGTGAATAFVVPALMTVFWRRATDLGTLAAMLAGTGTTLGLYAVGWWHGSFRPYLLLSVHPLLWGLAMSAVTGLLVSLVTSPPDEELIARCFDVEPEPPPPAKQEPAPRPRADTHKQSPPPDSDPTIRLDDSRP